MLENTFPIFRYIKLSKRRFFVSLSAIFLLGSFLRFWNLDQFNQLIFDEVYFPKFAYDYLNQNPFFHSHPPLGKFTQAAGIWIYNHLPWVNDPAIGSVELQKLNAHSWRWVNAFFGSLLILLVGLTVYTLTQNQLFALLAALFITLDGSMLVASRYGLSNVQVLFFGFLSLLSLAKALTTHAHPRLWLFFCGLFLGCTASIKWNGLGYSLICWSFLFGGTLYFYLNRWLEKVDARYTRQIPPNKNKEVDGAASSKDKFKAIANHSNPSTFIAPSQSATEARTPSLFSRIKIYELVAFLILLPAAIYSATWIPDLALNSRHAKYGFVGMHKQITSYHSKRVGANSHPYCSKWYSWPFLLRPINYHFEKTKTITPEGKIKKTYRDVHLLGNPALYWIGIIALSWVFIQWLYSLFVWLRLRIRRQHFLIHSFISLGFLANFLPWMLVSRCTFFYHYQSASIFKFLALALVTSELFKQDKKLLKITGCLIVTIVITVFFYLIPINLGLPIDSSAFYARMWLKSWI